MEGIRKTFEIAGSKGVTAQVSVVEDYSVADNTSTLTVAVSLKNTSYAGHIYYLNGSVSAAGHTLQTMSSSGGTHYVYIQNRNTYYPVASDATGYSGSPWNTTSISHDTDGSKTITVAIDITGYQEEGKGSNGFKVSGSQSITLTKIPRASTIGATDANIGASSMIAVSRKSTSYSHSIQYKFGSVSGYVDASGNPVSSEVKITETSVAFKVPTSFYAQIPNAKTGTCTLTCRTYSGSTQIGSAQTCTFTASTTEESCAPQVSGTVKDSNTTTVALTGNASVMVRYVSNALCTLSATARNSASITAKAINGTLIDGNTMTISGISESRVRFSAKDSRGYITDIPVDFSVVPYVVLTCVATGKRNAPTDGTATLTIKGNYFNQSFGAENNTLTLRYKQSGGSWVSITPKISGNTYTASVSLTDLTYTESFTFTVEATDKLATVSQVVKIDKGIPVFDWGENDFAFHVPVSFSNSVPVNVDIDNLCAPGWYHVSQTMTIGGIKANYWYIHVSAYNSGSSHCVQEMYPVLSSGYCKIIRRKHAGEWGASEVENPPMEAGVEYRTTERYKGKSVYRKLITYTNDSKIGSASGVANTSIPHNISGFSKLVRVTGKQNGNMLPYLTTSGAMTFVSTVTAKNVFIDTLNIEWASREWEFDIAYTKD